MLYFAWTLCTVSPGPGTILDFCWDNRKSSVSAGGRGPPVPQQAHTMRREWPFCKSPQEWGRLCLSPPAHTHTHQTRPCHLPFYPLLSSRGLRIIYMCSVQKALPLASGVFSTPALVFKPLPVQTGSEMNTLENRGAASQWGESQILIPERGWEG